MLTPKTQGALKAYERSSNGTCSRLSRLAKLSDSASVTPRLPLKTRRWNKVIAKGAGPAVGSTKLRPRFVGPFTVIGVHGHAYTLDLPSSMATHPTFYVGLLKPYWPAGAEPAESTASKCTDEGVRHFSNELF
ncbi:hypothetical protein PF005_g19235 [Phytophthora fragariae]|uniref:Tf2-1-like SH3-like domain-containing protein n=1 Tax=Phytophthora fragariae TaxID=53985 RepID=A0A6A3WTJ4_9STRA|nr:hypothetical protein PF011_g18078 [Phytophthora fragariae]KAE9190487.1 hypothetical protein PF005_g19235 [Phytophthora fragariae]